MWRRRGWRVYLLAQDDGAGGGGGGSAGGGGGTTTTGAGGSGDGTSSGGSSGGGSTGSNGATTGDADTAARLAVVEAELKRARDEAAASRRELADLKRAGESETERAQRERAEADRHAAATAVELRELRLATTVGGFATTLGIVDPEVATGLVAKRLESGDYDGEGRPKKDAVEKALRQLVKDKPYLVRSGGGDGGGGGDRSQDAGGDMNARIRRAAGR